MKNSDIFQVPERALEANRTLISLAELVTFGSTFGAKVPADPCSAAVTSLAIREPGKASVDPMASRRAVTSF